jgi:acetoin utilization deacetylase AcuC-like enzyme
VLRLQRYFWCTDGCGDAGYLQALEQALLALGSRFKPSLVIYLAGADAFEGDRLGTATCHCIAISTGVRT